MSAPAQGAGRLRGDQNALQALREGLLAGRKSKFAEIWSSVRLNVQRRLRYADHP